MTTLRTQDKPTATTAIRFTDALRFWLKLGFVSFGGPAGQIAIMHEELVERRRWISEKRFLHALNYCMVLPGPEAQQLATYIGWLLHRLPGALAAGILFIAPSLALLIALSWIYIAYGNQPLIAGIFYGIKPVVTAIVLQAAFRIGSRTLQNGMLWTIAVAAFIAIFVFHAPFPAILLGAALIGTGGSRLAPHYFRQRSAQQPRTASDAPTMIDDDSPVPAHARFSYLGLTKIIACGFLLWSLPLALLVWLYGWQGLPTQLGWFFTKAAWLTFGGAYAVLPYVYQGAVSGYGWLSAAQMIDGLALGETTPGPLIMVVSFVGFIAGYTHPLFDHHLSGNAFLSGAFAATLVTYFTFLPSFLLILGGAPLIESTHNDVKFTAPLTAITAAIVGVIVNLAVFFARQVMWPHGLAAELDAAACAIAVCAAVALLRYRLNILWVLLGGAATGLLWSLLR
ncbi:MAG TPA: chromate efflux transporter [Spongiibacteraceae bacterium]|nr:chromate efflux transporter [Spongiibacteraceae bacterium]